MRHKADLAAAATRRSAALKRARPTRMAASAALKMGSITAFELRTMTSYRAARPMK